MLEEGEGGWLYFKVEYWQQKWQQGITFYAKAFAALPNFQQMHKISVHN